MSWSRYEKTNAGKALSSMSGMQYRIVELATSEPNAFDYAAGGAGFGIIVNEPAVGEAATVVSDGEVPCKAGLAVSIGDYITCATSATGGSGWATAVVSGMALPRTILGRARSAAASGSVFTLDMGFRQRVFVTSAAVIN